MNIMFSVTKSCGKFELAAEFGAHWAKVGVANFE
jgi:hypothetical protein